MRSGNNACILAILLYDAGYSIGCGARYSPPS